ncbi:MAG: response regulator [bacterium]
MDKKINLLVVDDEKVFLESIKKRLELRGFNVVAVDCGEKALQAADNCSLDIALLDLKMPGMDGEQTLVELKKRHPAIEVIILTGHGSINSAIECTKEGAYKYLQKPCELEKMMETLSEAYKLNIMRRKMLKEKQMENILKTADATEPMDILRTLMKLDNE